MSEPSKQNPIAYSIIRRLSTWQPLLWHGCLVMLSYFACSLILTWPLVTQFTTHLAGAGSDLFITQWDCWWVFKVVTEFKNPLYTDLLFYPTGTSLRFHSASWLTGIMALPFRAAWGPTVAYNCVVIGQFVLCALATYLVTRYLTGRADIAWLTGLMSAAAPYRMSQATCHPNLAFTACIPLVLLTLMLALRREHIGWAWLASVFTALVLLTGAHLFIMLMLLVCLFFLYEGIIENRIRSKRFWLTILHYGLGGICFVTPFMMQYIGPANSPDNIESAVQLDEAKTKQTDLIAYFVPSKFHPLLSQSVENYYTQTFNANRAWIATLGYTPLLLMIIGIFTPRTFRRSLFWSLATLVFAALALGPILRVGGQLYDIWMPYDLIGWLSPIKALRSPDRLNLIVMICMPIAAAWGLLALSPSQKRTSWAIMIATPLVLFEYLPTPYPTTNAELSKFYSTMRADTDNYAILELPPWRKESKYSMYAQTIHSRPLVNGMVARTPNAAYQFIRQSPLLTSFYSGRPLDCRVSTMRRELERLVENRVRYIIVREDLMNQRVKHFFKQYFTSEPYYADEQIRVYELSLLLANRLPCD